MASSNFFRLPRGVVYPFQPVPEDQRGPIHPESRGAQQHWDVITRPQDLTFVPAAPLATTATWANVPVPLYLNSARYDVDSRRLQVTVQRPPFTYGDMHRWAQLHNSTLPDWVDVTLALVQHPQVRRWAGPALGALAGVMFVRHAPTIAAVVLGAAWACRHLKQRGAPMDMLQALVRGDPLTVNVDLSKYGNSLATFDGQLQGVSDNLRYAMSHAALLLDLERTNVGVEYHNPHGLLDGFTDQEFVPQRVYFSANSARGQKRDWELNAVVHGTVPAKNTTPAQPIKLSLNMGVNVPDVQNLAQEAITRSQRVGRRSLPPPDAVPLPLIPPALPPVNTASVRNLSCTQRVLPALRELANLRMHGTVQFRHTRQPLTLKTLWPSAPGLLRMCTIKTTRGSRLDITTLPATPTRMLEIVATPPTRDSLTFQLGLSEMLASALPALVQGFNHMPCNRFLRDLADAVLPAMGLQVSLRKIVARPAALLGDSAQQPWLEVAFGLQRLPVLPGGVGNVISRLIPGMGKMFGHRFTFTGPLHVHDSQPAWKIHLRNDEDDLQNLEIDVPMAMAGTVSAMLSQYVSDLVALYPPTLRALFEEGSHGAIDLSPLTSATHRGLFLHIDRTGQEDGFALRSESTDAKIKARLDLPRS